MPKAAIDKQDALPPFTGNTSRGLHRDQLLKPSRRERFFQWIDKRNRVANQHTLNYRNLYIFPTKKGFLFVLLAVVLWVMGTNYQNNLIIAIAFFVISLLVVIIHTTFFQLSGLQVGIDEVDIAEEHSAARVKVLLFSKHVAQGISLAWQNTQEISDETQLCANTPTVKELSIPVGERGIYKLPRLLIQSEAPFGLVRCWTWLRFSGRIAVYPAPEVCDRQAVLAATSGDEKNHAVQNRTGDDFAGLAAFQDQDSMQRVAWKQLARGRGMLVKEFEHAVTKSFWLSLESMVANGTEDKLAGIAWWAKQLEARSQTYGLDLSNTQLPLARGEHHLKMLRLALAYYPAPPPSKAGSQKEPLV